MSRIGLFSLPATGHLYPCMAVAGQLVREGHEILFFQDPKCRALLAKAGFTVKVLEEASCPELWHDFDGVSSSDTIKFIGSYSSAVLACAPTILASTPLDALIVDGMVPAGGVMADVLDIPFISLSCSVPLYLEEDTPPVTCGWSADPVDTVRSRNIVANAALTRRVRPVLDTLNRERVRFGLSPLHHPNDTFSRRGIIVQSPEEFDFERSTRPSHYFYGGHFKDPPSRRRIPFCWSRLDDRPLIYASMGTVRNTTLSAFRVIAESCPDDCQLVISLGGGTLFPRDLGPVRENVIVVHYAPQVDLIGRAELVISHAGMNTTLESLAQGLPIVAVPITDDQPGIAARIVKSGVGVRVDYRALTAAGLAKAIYQVRNDSLYRSAALRMRTAILNSRGVEGVARLIGSLLGAAEPPDGRALSASNLVYHRGVTS